MEADADREGPSPQQLHVNEYMALARLHEASSRLTGNQDLSTLLQDVVDAAIAVSGAQMGYMQLADESSTARRIVAHRGFEQDFLEKLATLPDTSIEWTAALQQRERVVIEDINESRLRETPWLPVLQSAGVRSVQITPMMARDGRVLGVYATHWREPHRLSVPTLLILDLLARQAADLIEHRRREHALSEIDRRKDEFLAMLGHELRNPLTPIALVLTSIKRHRKDPFKKEHETIERQIRHLVRLVDDLLDVTRITRGTLQIRKRPMALKNAVLQALQVAMPLIEKRKHRLYVDVPRIYMSGDEERLAQVFANLLTNAARYTLPGGHITIEAKRERRGEVTLRVRDDGIGMPAHFVPKAFHLFTQAADSGDRMAGGLGLGLAIVSHIVGLHNGTVEAQSDGPGKGSTFTVRLPEVEGKRIKGVSTAPSLSRRGLRQHQILLVDDNNDVLEWLPVLLTKLGHTVKAAKSGEEALALVRTFVPEIAILDLGLPDMDGYEIATRLCKALSDNPPQLIALTGFGQDVDRDRCRATGFVAHVTKPNLEGLIQAIDTCTNVRDVAALAAQ
jgi:signal transduction histidine kinase/ActR/RegA family two-component response regulator